jgi:hypothetical protein
MIVNCDFLKTEMDQSHRAGNAEKCSVQKGVARESQGRSRLEAFEHTIIHRAPNKPPNLAAMCRGGSEWEWGYAGR